MLDYAVNVSFAASTYIIVGLFVYLALPMLLDTWWNYYKDRLTDRTFLRLEIMVADLRKWTKILGLVIIVGGTTTTALNPTHTYKREYHDKSELNSKITNELKARPVAPIVDLGRQPKHTDAERAERFEALTDYSK